MVVECEGDGGNKRSKDTYKVMCGNKTEENKNRYKSMQIKTNKMVSKAMGEKAESLSELGSHLSGVFIYSEHYN